MRWVIWMAVMVGGAGTPAAEGPRIGAADLAQVRLIPVQHEGRCSPLDTLARDVVGQVAETSRWSGRDPVLDLLDWTFRPEVYRDEPLLHVGGAEVRRLIGLPIDRASFSLRFLAEHEGLQRRLVNVMTKRRQGERLDALDQKVEQLGSRMTLLEEVLEDEMIRPIPDPNDPSGRWRALSSSNSDDDEPTRTARQRWEQVKAAFRADDPPRFRMATAALLESLGHLQGAHRPDIRRMELELRYNTLDPFGRSWWLSAVAALTALVSLTARRRWVDGVVWLVLAGVFGLVTYGIGMRWHLAGRIPAANMYESLILMGWGLCLACLLYTSPSPRDS